MHSIVLIGSDEESTEQARLSLLGLGLDYDVEVQTNTCSFDEVRHAPDAAIVCIVDAYPHPIGDWVRGLGAQGRPPVMCTGKLPAREVAALLDDGVDEYVPLDQLAEVGVVKIARLLGMEFDRQMMSVLTR